MNCEYNFFIVRFFYLQFTQDLRSDINIVLKFLYCWWIDDIELSINNDSTLLKILFLFIIFDQSYHSIDITCLTPISLILTQSHIIVCVLKLYLEYKLSCILILKHGCFLTKHLSHVTFNLDIFLFTFRANFNLNLIFLDPKILSKHSSPFKYPGG